MELKKIDRDQAFNAINEGLTVYRVMKIGPYTMYSIKELVEMEFAIEVIPESDECPDISADEVDFSGGGTTRDECSSQEKGS